MKKILMPKQGVLFHKDNTYRLDYCFEDGFVDCQLLSASSVQQIYEYTQTSYRKIGKLVLTKKQFENYLFSELFTDQEFEISFENE